MKKCLPASAAGGAGQHVPQMSASQEQQCHRCGPEVDKDDPHLSKRSQCQPELYAPRSYLLQAMRAPQLEHSGATGASCRGDRSVAPCAAVVGMGSGGAAASGSGIPRAISSCTAPLWRARAQWPTAHPQTTATAQAMAALAAADTAVRGAGVGGGAGIGGGAGVGGAGVGASALAFWEQPAVICATPQGLLEDMYSTEKLCKLWYQNGLDVKLAEQGSFEALTNTPAV